MKRLLFPILCVLAIPVVGQITARPWKSPSAEEMAAINQPLQNIQMTMSILMQEISRMDPEKQRRLAQKLKQMDTDLKAAADPTGVRAAMTNFTMTLQSSRMALYGGSPENGAALAKQLQSIDKEMSAFVDPEALARIKNVRREGNAKGNLGAFRSALSIFYGDHEGKYPNSAAEMVPKYLSRIPTLDVPNHTPNAEVRAITGVQSMEELKKRLKDSGQWMLVTDPKSKITGTVIIDCTHTDARGTEWNAY